jgi:hypothetical protein
MTLEGAEPPYDTQRSTPLGENALGGRVNVAMMEAQTRSDQRLAASAGLGDWFLTRVFL